MRNALRRYGPAAVGVAVVVGIFGFALPRIADYRDVIDVVSGLSWWEIVALAVATLWNVVTFAPPWRAAMPGLSLWRALVMTQASTAAASAFPGGEAVGLGLGFGMLRAWGFRSGAIAAAVALVTVMNTLAKVLLPAAALVGLLVTGRQGGLLGLLTVIGVGAICLLFGAAIMALRTDASTRVFAARLAVWRTRVPILRRRKVSGSLPDRLSRFRGETLGLLRPAGLRC